MANVFLNASHSFSPRIFPRVTSIAVTSSNTCFRPHQLQQLHRLFNVAFSSTMAPANGDNGDAGEMEGEHNQWKYRAPYKVHENDKNFSVRYEGSCHCGKVKYQLSRDKPLDAKFCHCTTCQKIHGKNMNPWVKSSFNAQSRDRSSLPMGFNLPQGRYQLHARTS